MTTLVPLSDDELLPVLQSSLYPGADPSSIRLVIGYCKAAGLDPMQKPVHIVPMWDDKAGRMRDVIMPGVNLYRTQASRSGQFAGMSEPEFGPEIAQTIGGKAIKFPEWCRVTVKRALSNGIVAEFTAVEYWLENYAIKGGKEKSIAPNAMWTKRPRGQLAKCAAAQALRIAFPEIASQPTAEEMEGKTMQADDVVDMPPACPPELVAEATRYADLGVAAYRDFWQAASRETRQALVSHHEQLKSRAAEADKSRAATPALPPAAPAADSFIADMDAAETAALHDADR